MQIFFLFFASAGASAGDCNDPGDGRQEGGRGWEGGDGEGAMGRGRWEGGGATRRERQGWGKGEG